MKNNKNFFIKSKKKSLKNFSKKKTLKLFINKKK